MKIPGTINNNKGFALVLALVVMAAMTAIGIAALLLSTTDMMIARNDRDSKSAFFLSETGMEEALGRTDLPTANARFAGETFNERTTRIAGTSTTFAADSFDSSSLNLGMGGTYDATLSYARESMADAWCDSDGCDNDEIVLYCKDFGFKGTMVPRTCSAAVPVYRIDSTSTTTPGGTQASVRAYMAASTLNVVPPAGDIFSNTTIGAGGSSGITGAACSEAAITGCGADCDHACDGAGDTGYPGDAYMVEYLGVDLTDLKNYADPPSPYNQAGANVVYDTSDWGAPCDTVADSNGDGDITQADVPDHICGNDSKIIYIDNVGKTAKITANGQGRGVLVVRGDLDVSGNFWWEGMIYVMGHLKGNGTVVVFGTIMANDTIDFNGNITAVGSIEVAAGVAQTIGIPRMLRWSRQ